MVKSGFRKLKNRRGESLVEALVAILAFTLSSLLMYSMVTTAADINRTARKEDEAFQKQVKIVEEAQGVPTYDKVSVSLTESPGYNNSKSMGEVEVAVYKGEDLTAYYVVPEGGG